jgi:hypothetical protein
LVQNDFKLLNSLYSEDIHYLADLVEAKKISVKSSKAKKGDNLPTMDFQHAAGIRERLI